LGPRSMTVRTDMRVILHHGCLLSLEVDRSSAAVC
jgi:hypothetical protein